MSRAKIGLVLMSCGVLAIVFGLYLTTLPTHASCTYYPASLYGRPCGTSWLRYEANAAVYLLGFEFPLQIYYDFGTPVIMIAVFWALMFSGMWFTVSGSPYNLPSEREK